MPDRRSNRPLVILALAAAVALSGCNKAGDTGNIADAANSTAPLPALPATLPMATGVATAASVAPPVTALPAARPIRTVRVANSGDAYAYADDAYAFSHAVGNAPPDYAFDYQGSEPWAWQGYDESRTFVEPVTGGYRYYYYRPGADTPYFVRDPDYGYGYDDGSLAVIYGVGGAILPFADYGSRLGYASRYLRRGEDLYRASRGNDRRAVIAANWAARQDSIAASRDRWAAEQAQQAGWQAYRARAADQQAQHWAQEAARRDADAQRFAIWHDDGFRSAPPPRAIPVAWQQAPWAQDRQRYQVADRGRQPAFQPPVDQGHEAIAPQGSAVQAPPVPSPQRQFGGVGGAGLYASPVDQRTAPNAGRTQAEPAQAVREQAARASDRQQDAARNAQQSAARQQAVASHAQQQAARALQQQAAHQQQQVVRQTQQAKRRQQAATDRQQQNAVRQAEHAQPIAVRVHRGGDTSIGAAGPVSGGPQATRPQPPHVDQRAADRSAQQAEHRPQPMVHQQEAAAHHASSPPPHDQLQRAVQQVHAAPAPHPAPVPHPEGGEHGGHRP